MVSLRTASKLAMISLLAAGIGGCSTFNLNGNNTPVAQEPAVEPEIPATIRADELVGRWGLAAYHMPGEDGLSICRRLIGKGPTGGVIMHLADEATPQELRVKGSRSGKNYIGPAGPPGGPQDREIVSFDGRVLTTRFIDPDAATRYGTMVYVRCAPRA